MTTFGDLILFGRVDLVEELVGLARLHGQGGVQYLSKVVATYPAFFVQVEHLPFANIIHTHIFVLIHLHRNKNKY